MLDIRHIHRRLRARGHEDFHRFVRVPEGTIVEAFRNLGIRLDFAVLDGDAEFLVPRLPPIESNLIDAEGVGHFLVGGTKECKPSAEFSEFRTIEGGCTLAYGFGDLLRGDASRAPWRKVQQYAPRRPGDYAVDTRFEKLRRVRVRIPPRDTHQPRSCPWRSPGQIVRGVHSEEQASSELSI